MAETSLHEENPRRRGEKNHLIKTVIKQVELHRYKGKHSAIAMGEIMSAVRRYQKEMAK